MRNARGKVNIMGHQQSLPGRKRENKLLVMYSLPIIRKHPADDSLSADLNVTFSFSIGRGDCTLPVGGYPAS